MMIWAVRWTRLCTSLQTIYSTVLPICTICKSLRAKTLVGRYIPSETPNGKAIEKSRLDQKIKAEAAAAVAARSSAE